MATAAQLLGELKHVLYESEYDGFWTDAMLYGLLAEGQDQFCEDTGFFVDPLTYKVTTAVDTQHYAISDRIIRVLNVYDEGRPLRRFEEQSKDQWDDLPVSEIQNTEPRMWAWQTDFNPGYLTLWPIPTVIRPLTMRVWRYSKKILCESTGTQTEIPSKFERACVQYAAWKALGSHDAELGDEMSAKDHKDNYDDYAAKGEAAFRRLRGSEQRIAPNPSYVV